MAWFLAHSDSSHWSGEARLASIASRSCWWRWQLPSVFSHWRWPERCGVASRTNGSLAWPERAQLVCPGVPCFSQWLDSTGTQAFSPFNFSLAVSLFWIQRNLHVGAGPALEQAGFFPIGPTGRFTALGASKTRIGSWNYGSRFAYFLASDEAGAIGGLAVSSDDSGITKSMHMSRNT